MASKRMHCPAGPFTNTVATQYAQRSLAAPDMFTPGWDKKVSGEQAMERNKARLAMGKKKTPPGVGVLIPKG